MYKDCVSFELVDSAQPPYEVKAAVWRGTNSFSKFGHHNKNGGAVDNT
jgi:hypothetical protein